MTTSATAKFAASGGNEWGSGLRQGNYTPNNLNQYTSRTVPSYIDVLGSAKSNATVTVNDVSTYRKGEYFSSEVPVTNGAGPIWLSLTNLAVLNDGSNPDITTNFVGDRYVPKAAQVFAYDADGNLTNDSRWVYVWDAENRLISMTSSNLPSAAGNLKLEFDYDYAWRRIAKRVFNSAGQLLRNHRFAYDGWNLLGELNTTNNATIRKYVWGLDVSGGRRGAGGVGGLLVINDTIEGMHFPAYDGNGNVSALVKAMDSSTSATYEYSPFGETIRTTGPVSKPNPFRFSTKYADDESDLIYYGFRFYGASTGRWLSRDPIGEDGGLNLQNFVHNGPLSAIDALGLQVMVWGRPMTQKDCDDHAKRYCDQFGARPSSAKITTQTKKFWVPTDKNPLGRYIKKTEYTCRAKCQGEMPCPFPLRGGEMVLGPEWKTGAFTGDDYWVKLGDENNPDDDQTLYWDENHPPPLLPHWDYKTPVGKFRIFPNQGVMYPKL